MGAMEWMVMYIIILLNITSNNAESGQQQLNVKTISLWSSAVLCVLVKIYVITSDTKSKCTWSKCVLCIPYILCGSPNECLHTCMEIRIAGSSCRPWLSFIQIQTCQYIIANSFWFKLINLLKHEIFVLLWQEFLKTSQVLLHISNNFPKVFQTLLKNVWSCFDNLWAILKLFQVSKGNWIEFLSVMMC